MNYLDKCKDLYFLGIKGVGMTGLAQILKYRGYLVRGSDTKEKFFTDQVLKENKINFYEGFSASNIKDDISCIIYSTAYSEKNNKEFKAAKDKGIPLIPYHEMVADLFNSSKGLAVTGTHGKTTTSALLAYVLREYGLNPNALIGSRVFEFNGNALVGSSDYFVLEADEYQNKLKYYDPWAVILTNVDYDHPDTYPDKQAYNQAFIDFIAKIPDDGVLVACFDDLSVQEILKDYNKKFITYGFGKDCDFRAEKEDNYHFDVYKDNKKILDKVNIHLLGDHNILNFLGVLSLVDFLGLDLAKVKDIAGNFKGTARRLEVKGVYNQAVLIDDYAHHPKEIKATLKALSEHYADKKIYCIFQPHTFTRTKKFFSEFVTAFDLADEVIIMDIYASAREKKGTIKALDLVNKIKENGVNAKYIPTREKVVKYLSEKLNKNDIAVTMGAGDVWQVARSLIDHAN